jgi:TM2 domain-containing membrane protein YozV
MMAKRILVYIFFFFGISALKAADITETSSCSVDSSYIDSASFIPVITYEETPGEKSDLHNPNKIIKKVRDGIKKRKKLIAACLAFPVPFGIFGGHRIYLGSQPYVPLIYILTLGGACGILPFIDFVVILLDKDITRFEKNKKVFMWVK